MNLVRRVLAAALFGVLVFLLCLLLAQVPFLAVLGEYARLIGLLAFVCALVFWQDSWWGSRPL